MITDKTLQGHVQKDKIESAFNWTSIRLNREERVNNKGIELTYKNTLAGGNYTLYVWTELRKTAQLVNGQFSCYFA